MELPEPYPSSSTTFLLLLVLEHARDVRNHPDTGLTDRDTEDIEDSLNAPLVHRLREVELVETVLRELRPQRDSQLTREIVDELLQVLPLHIGQRREVLRDVVGDLLDCIVETILGAALHLRLRLRVGLDDVLPVESIVDRLREVEERDRRLGSNEPERRRIETRVLRGVRELRLDQCLVQALPGTSARVDRAHLGTLRRVEPLVGSRDEVGDHRVDCTDTTSPVHPVLRIRAQVDDPEPVEQRGIHFVDRVLGRAVHRSEDSGAGM